MPVARTGAHQNKQFHSPLQEVFQKPPKARTTVKQSHEVEGIT